MPSLILNAVSAGFSPSLVMNSQPSSPLARRSVNFDSSAKAATVEKAMTVAVMSFIDMMVMGICG